MSCKIVPIGMLCFIALGCKNHLPMKAEMWHGKTAIVHENVILSRNVSGEYLLLTDMFSCEQQLFKGEVVSTNGNTIVLWFNLCSGRTNTWDVVHFPSRLSFGNDNVKASFIYRHGAIRALLHREKGSKENNQ